MKKLDATSSTQGERERERGDGPSLSEEGADYHEKYISTSTSSSEYEDVDNYKDDDSKSVCHHKEEEVGNAGNPNEEQKLAESLNTGPSSSAS